MAIKKSVTIELDKARNLRYGINALVTAEEKLGKPITEINLNSLSMKNLRDILYAGLVHEDSSLTPEIVGNIIDDYSDIQAVANKLGEALSIAFGENKRKNMKAPQTKSGD